MKHRMLLFVFLLITTGAFGQIAYLQYRHVPAEHEEKFVELETKYWSKVAKAAIDKGQMVGWALWRKVGVTTADAPNYVFTNVFESFDQLNQEGVWASNLKELNLDPSLIGTNAISTVTFDYYVQIEASIPGDYKYAIVNYALPEDLDDFIEENKKLWKPFHEANIKNGSMGMTAWGLSSVVYPQGNMDRFSCYTYDGFNTLSDAMDYMRYVEPTAAEGPWSEILSKTRMGDIMPDGFQRRIIYELVMSVGN